MAADPKPLDPQAREYIPLSNSLALVPHFNLHPLISLAFPTSRVVTFIHPSPPPLHFPAFFTSIHNEIVLLFTPFLPQHSSNFLPLPPPPPQLLDDAPPSPPAVSPPAAAMSEPAELVLSEVAVKPSGRRVGRSGSSFLKRGKGWFGRGSSTGFSSSMHEEIRADKNRTCVEKHHMLPLRRDEDNTTVMIKNIPYEFTRLMLVEFLDHHCMIENEKAKQGMRPLEAEENPRSAYDFLYLPIDFGTKKNKGYGFVNFTKPEAAWKFFQAYDATKWDFKDSSKLRRIVCASIQGKKALLKHFQMSNFGCESDEFLPLCFSPPRDGSGDNVKLTSIGNVKGRRSDQTKNQLLI